MRKLKISATFSCRFCNTPEETLIHLFTSCPVVLEFWNNLRKWLQQQFNLYLDPSPHTIIFGVLEKDIDFFSRNCVILIVKKIIFDSARNPKILSTMRFRAYFKCIFTDQEFISKINCCTEKFQANWSLFKNL